MGRDSSVGITTCYGLDGPGIESRWGTRFSAPFQTGPEHHPASYTMGTESLPVVKRPGRGVDYPPPSNAEVKERVELYLYSPLWAFLACSKVNFTFTLPLTRAEYTLTSESDKSQCLRRVCFVTLLSDSLLRFYFLGIS